MPARPAQANLYLQRINAVIGYVRAHLTDPLPLGTLAQVAGFSPFHFHRLFKTLTGETVSDLVLRLRLERAVALLQADPRRTLTAAALDCGFQSAAVFSRAFKRRYGLTARQWDRRTPLPYSKNDQAPGAAAGYTLAAWDDPAGRAAFTVRLQTLPAQRLAYMRVYDAYNHPTRITDAYARLFDWFARRGGRREHTTLYGLSQDDPDVTPARLCRFDWALTVPGHWPAEGEVNVVDWPACRVAVIAGVRDLEQEDRAFHYLFRTWLPRSRYQPANLPAMEIYRRLPAELGWAAFELECAVPVVAL